MYTIVLYIQICLHVPGFEFLNGAKNIEYICNKINQSLLCYDLKICRYSTNKIQYNNWNTIQYNNMLFTEYFQHSFIRIHLNCALSTYSYWNMFYRKRSQACKCWQWLNLKKDEDIAWSNCGSFYFHCRVKSSLCLASQWSLALLLEFGPPCIKKVQRWLMHYC
jgi:hypothetical protein